METVKILHCADLHIGAALSFLGEKAELRRREILLTFEKIVDLCAEHNVQVLLIAGDLFDSNLIENHFTSAVINKINSAPDLKVVFSAGNHDPFNPRSPFFTKKPQNFHILSTDSGYIDFKELNLRIYGRSFETAFLNDGSASFIPENNNTINILLQHGDLFADSESQYNPISRSFIENSKMDYIALGHIHKRSEIEKLGNTYFAYSGCPEGQGFDEIGEKGVYIGNIGKGICELEFVPTAKRKHITENIDISTASDSLSDCILNLLENKYGEAYTQNLYKIVLTGSTREDNKPDLSDITARLESKLYFVKIKDRTEEFFDLKELSKEQSLKGIFVKKMLEKISQNENDERLKAALLLGLKAFDGEVKFDEN